MGKNHWVIQEEAVGLCFTAFYLTPSFVCSQHTTQ